MKPLTATKDFFTKNRLGIAFTDAAIGIAILYGAESYDSKNTVVPMVNKTAAYAEEGIAKGFTIIKEAPCHVNKPDRNSFDWYQGYCKGVK